MAVSGFFIEIFKELASAFVEKIDGFIRDENEKKQIEQKLNEHFDRYFKEKYEYLLMSKEFDIQSLHEWLLENLYKRVAICFLADTSAKRYYYKDSLIKHAYTKANADTEEKKQGVHAYVDSFLKTFEHYNFFQKINEMDQYLFNQQTEEIKTIIQSEKKELEDFIRYRGSFAEYIDSIELKLRKTQFHYLNPKIGFVRREAQFKVLDGFLKDGASLLSLAITGYGGIGKSKLLHQYMLELCHNLEWKAVMLNCSHVDYFSKLPHWNYPKNLLLVIDDAAENPEKIGEWIRKIYNSSSRSRKMRIVFLERQGLIAVNEQIILPLWYQNINKESDKVLEELQYSPVNGFYELSRFTKDEMFQVMDMHPELENELPQTIKESIYDKIVSFSDDGKDERFNTPLIALLLVDAHLNDKSIPDPKKLMEYVIERNKDSLERFFPDPESRKNLVDAVERLMVYATATGGLDLSKPLSFLDDDRKLLENTLEEDKLVSLIDFLNGGTQAHNYLEPLKPDIIGEYFVLDYIYQRRRSDLCKEMVKACWKKPNGGLLFFLDRCTRSYLGDFPDLVFDKDSILFHGTHPLGEVAVLFGMTTTPDFDYRQKAVERIEEIYKENQEAMIPELYAKGLYNLLVKQEKVAARQTFEKLKMLNNQWSENPVIALAYARGTVIFLTNQKGIEACQIVNNLKKLSNQWSENSEIALAYAQSLVNYPAEQEENSDCRHVIDELKKLSEQWPENPGIGVAYAMGLFNLFNKQEETTARQTADELKNFCNKRHEILGFTLQLANIHAADIKKENKPDDNLEYTKLMQLIQSLKMIADTLPIPDTKIYLTRKDDD